MTLPATFPVYRPRRLRQSEALRRLVRETILDPSSLVLPVFVRSGRKLRRPIQAMPGVCQLSPDELLREAQTAFEARLPAVLLFGIPDKKDAKASGAYAANGIVQQAVKLLKREIPDLLVITDVCLCEYTSHGHCGPLTDDQSTVKNDETVANLVKQAINHARFEIARIAWQYDAAFAETIIRSVRRSQPQFVPHGNGAPWTYRLAWKVFGFRNAERVASWRRRFSRGAIAGDQSRPL